MLYGYNDIHRYFSRGWQYGVTKGVVMTGIEIDAVSLHVWERVHNSYISVKVKSCSCGLADVWMMIFICDLMHKNIFCGDHFADGWKGYQWIGKMLFIPVRIKLFYAIFAFKFKFSNSKIRSKILILWDLIIERSTEPETFFYKLHMYTQRQN